MSAAPLEQLALDSHVTAPETIRCDWRSFGTIRGLTIRRAMPCWIAQRRAKIGMDAPSEMALRIIWTYERLRRMNLDQATKIEGSRRQMRRCARSTPGLKPRFKRLSRPVIAYSSSLRGRSV